MAGKITITKRNLSIILSLLVLFLMLFGSISVFAQDGGPGVRRGYHRETGRVNFIGASPRQPLSIAAAQEPGMRASDRAMAYLQHYGPEFGLQNAEGDLSQLKVRARRGGGEMRRYQQTYEGVPVIAGELIINMDDSGRMLSLNGEISPDLDLSTEAQVSSAEARTIALGLIAKAYGLS
ncbi:MAG: hypothetical protein PVF85_12675, partial [Anaerolineales bacterium]